MTANIEFKNDQNTSALKIITVSDRKGNTYTLDAADVGLKLKYKPYGQAEVEYEVNGLAATLRSLLDIKSDTGRETTVLAEKVAEWPIVEAMLYAKDGSGNRISDTVLMHTFARRDDVSSYINSKLEKKADKDELNKKSNVDNVYTKEEINNKLETKANNCDVCTKEEIKNKLETKADTDGVYTKGEIDNRLETKANTFEVYTKPEANEKFFPLAEHKALAQEILRQRVDGGSILVKTLGKFLDEEYVWYGDERNQTAKDFLAEKGEFTKVDGSNVKIPNFTNKIFGATKNVEEEKKRSIDIDKIAKEFLDEKDMQRPEGEAQSPAAQTSEGTELGPEILGVTKMLMEPASNGAIISQFLVDEKRRLVGSDEEVVGKIPIAIEDIEGSEKNPILVEKSEEFLDASDQAYDNKIAKDENFIKDVTTMVVSNPIFQESVEGMVSQVFGVLDGLHILGV